MAREDYGTAGCPMLGVVDASGRSSARVSLVYAAMVICAGVVAAESDSGALYIAAALVTGAAFVGFAWSFVRRPALVPALRLFLSSLLIPPLLLGR